MEKTDKNFEVGGWAKHLYINTSRELYIANVSDKSVLVRYAVDNVFYSQEFFKHELEPHQKKPGLPLSGIRVR